MSEDGKGGRGLWRGVKDGKFSLPRIDVWRVLSGLRQSLELAVSISARQTYCTQNRFMELIIYAYFVHENGMLDHAHVMTERLVLMIIIAYCWNFHRTSPTP